MRWPAPPALLALLGLLGLLACKSEPTVQVNVKNASSGAVSDVTVVWEGEEAKIGAIPAGETRAAAIHPHAESGLAVKYRNAAGALLTQQTDIMRAGAQAPVDVDIGGAP